MRRWVRGEVRVVVHVHLLQRVLDDVHAPLRGRAHADEDAARAVGGLDTGHSLLDGGVVLQDVAQQEGEGDAGTGVLALVVQPHLLAHAQLHGRVAGDGTHEARPRQHSVRVAVALVGVVHQHLREFLERAVGGPVQSTQLYQRAVARVLRRRAPGAEHGAAGLDDLRQQRNTQQLLQLDVGGVGDAVDLLHELRCDERLGEGVRQVDDNLDAVLVDGGDPGRWQEMQVGFDLGVQVLVHLGNQADHGVLHHGTTGKAHLVRSSIHVQHVQRRVHSVDDILAAVGHGGHKGWLAGEHRQVVRRACAGRWERLRGRSHG
mmetsp:Transcript_39844/g.81531  ORF Transcript_39844/g.81531 Transcript_39844/m.81531 type:complete len:318 (+) Transcript_39844:400-1353(+)